MPNMMEYNTILAGRIVEYFPATQTATVKISSDRVYSNSSEDDIGTERGFLYDVPTFTSGGGGWHMTFPIKEDDPCLLKFSQIGYDHWLYDDKDKAGLRFDGKQMPWMNRKFSLQDGFAQVGFNTLPRAIQNYSDVHSQWRNIDAEQVISLNEDTSITITSPVKLTVNAPSVEVICETAEVTASTSTTITAPESTIDGNLTVTGTITGLSSMGLTAAITAAGGTFTGDVVAAGKSVSTHKHSAGGNPPI